jgi:DNA invertase Pin-like site-specific DNA recombinase
MAIDSDEDNTKKNRKKRKIVTLSEQKRLKAESAVNQRMQDNPNVFKLPVSKRSIDELTDYFAKQQESVIKILPKEKRKYVIYLRKSTDDEAKQVRSLEDQETECLELAKHMTLDIDRIKIISESGSAKKSGNRPIFDKMIEGFKTGKYHGLIAWSPDRLSRNMKEAGELIEMVDLEQIQDLAFRTYQFENNPNGKMLLGILFATSKQYSDKLSVDVSRGTSGNIKDGKYNGVVKKGYYIDKDSGHFIPDGYNWQLLREAVDMRLNQGKGNEEIANFLNDSHFSEHVHADDEYRVVKMTKNKLGNLFEDPFYFGLYRHGETMANLIDLYDFLPLITVDEYILLNREAADDFGKQYAGKGSASAGLEYGLLRGKVICDFCDSNMQFQHQEIKRGKNTGKWLISYYCRNRQNCVRHDEKRAKELYDKKLKKSVRGKFVVDPVKEMLLNYTQKSEEAYKFYIDKLEVKVAQEKAIAKRKLSEAKSSVTENNRQYAKYQDFQRDFPKEYAKHHSGKLEYHQNLINVAQANIKVANAELDRLKNALPTREQFYELTCSYLKTINETRDLLELDAVLNEVVLNLRAGDDSVSVIKLNPPYNMLVDLSKISTGRGYRIRTYDLSVPNRAR